MEEYGTLAEILLHSSACTLVMMYSTVANCYGLKVFLYDFGVYASLLHFLQVMCILKSLLIVAVCWWCYHLHCTCGTAQQDFNHWFEVGPGCLGEGSWTFLWLTSLLFIISQIPLFSCPPALAILNLFFGGGESYGPKYASNMYKSHNKSYKVVCEEFFPVCAPPSNVLGPMLKMAS